MKPIGRKNYGSIPHLSNSKVTENDYRISDGQERILTEKARDKHDVIYVFEKYDGSNVGIAKKNGNIYALTRAGYEASTSPFIQHHYFSNWVWGFESMFDEFLAEGERIAGEWLLQAHGLRYSILGNPIVFFDIFNANNERISQKELEERCARFNLKTPRKLHEGEPASVESLTPKLREVTGRITPVEGMPEGMVYRVERKGKVDFLAKWVRSDFPNGKYIIGVSDENAVWNQPIGMYQ
jgi:hypothetical protein